MDAHLQFQHQEVRNRVPLKRVAVTGKHWVHLRDSTSVNKVESNQGRPHINLGTLWADIHLCIKTHMHSTHAHTRTVQGVVKPLEKTYLVLCYLERAIDTPWPLLGVTRGIVSFVEIYCIKRLHKEGQDAPFPEGKSLAASVSTGFTDGC